jgi:hypothetical protein
MVGGEMRKVKDFEKRMSKNERIGLYMLMGIGIILIAGVFLI